MYPKNPLLQKCIGYIESLPGIQATVQGELYASTTVLADGKLDIKTTGKTVHYVCEIKTDLTVDTVEKVSEYFISLGKRLNPPERALLVTQNLSSFVVDLLVEKGVEFIDVDGHIYLNSLDMYVLVRENAAHSKTATSFDMTTEALQVIYALLKEPAFFKPGAYSFNIEETISRISGVTVETVITTLEKLQQLGYLQETLERYKVTDYVKLLERWELGYIERLRTKLLIGTFSPIGTSPFSKVSDKISQISERQYGFLIGGELAAAALTHYLRPVSTTFHVVDEKKARQIAVKLKLKPDPDGNVTFLRTFGSFDSQRNNLGLSQPEHLVNPLLVHAELMRTGDSRLKETAKRLYDQYLKDVDSWTEEYFPKASQKADLIQVDA